MLNQPNQPKLSHKLIIIIVILGGLGLVFTLLTQMTKKTSLHTTIVETNYDGSQSNFGRVNYAGPEPTLPETMAIFQLQQQLDQGLADKIANILNISAVEGEDGFWVNDQWNLVYDTTDNLVLLTSNAPHSSSTPIEENSAISQALEWMAKLNLPQNIEVIKDRIEYFEGEYELKPSTSQRAGLIQLQFGFTLGSTPLYSDKDAQAPYVIMLDSNYDLVKLIVYPSQLIDFQPTSEQPTLTIDQVVTNIAQQNLASVIELENDLGTQDLTQINRLDLTNAQIEYRVDTQTMTALPYYRFEGKATLADQGVVIVDIISPAIKI